MSFGELLDGFNDQWVATSGFLSTELVMALLGLVGEWSDAFYCTVGLETVAREPVGFFASREPSPYWQVISARVRGAVHPSITDSPRSRCT